MLLAEEETSAATLWDVKTDRALVAPIGKGEYRVRMEVAVGIAFGLAGD